jgi:hypothetical protein
MIGRKLDLVKTFMVCIYDSVWFLKACLSSSRFPFLVIFGAFSWRFSQSIFEVFLFGIFGWYMHEPFMVLFPLIPLPKSWEKGLNFGVIVVLGFAVFLAEILRFLSIQQVLVDHNLAMECPWGVPTTPKVLCESVEWIGKSGVSFGGVDQWVLFIPSCPGVTGLTGARDRSDQSEPFVGLASAELLDPCVFGLCCCWSVLGRFGVVLLCFV